MIGHATWWLTDPFSTMVSIRSSAVSARSLYFDRLAPYWSFHFSVNVWVGTRGPREFSILALDADRPTASVATRRDRLAGRDVDVGVIEGQGVVPELVDGADVFDPPSGVDVDWRLLFEEDVPVGVAESSRFAEHFADRAVFESV